MVLFAPEDLSLVRGDPGERRRYLDELLTLRQPRYAGVRADYDRVLKQRNALLRSSALARRGGGKPDLSTLDVWDVHLVRHGAELLAGRLELSAALAPLVGKAYDAVAAGRGDAVISYSPSWGEPSADLEGTLAAALRESRAAEIERGVTLVGPHRDDWKLTIDGLDARTQASQGEQRSLALALRLAGRSVVHQLTGTPPVLLLDDVFSELDARRSSALVRNLPSGQTLLTTAGVIPADVEPDRVLRISAGRIEEAGQ
jgi:DNA replication and repair protein RecF